MPQRPETNPVQHRTRRAVLAPAGAVRTFLLAALLLLMTGGTRAMAQGTAGLFPDPITVREVERWATVLELDAPRRAALADAHERYRESFAVLRDGPIERHVKEWSPLGGGTSPRELRDALRSRRSILDQITQLDAQLLSLLHEISGPDAATVVERFRLADERRRARGVLGMMTLAGGDLELGQELDAALDEAGTDDAPRGDVPTLVVMYEQRLTRLMRELADVAIRQPLALAEAFERAGLSEARGRGMFLRDEDPDGDRAAARALRDEVTAPQRRLRGEIAAAHREFVRSIADLVPDDAHRQVRNVMVRRVYRGNVLGRDLESSFVDALRRLEDDEAASSAVRDLRRQYRAARDGIVDAMMDAVDAQRRESSGPMMLPWEFDESGSPHVAAQRGLAERRNAVDEDFAARLATVAGEQAPPEDRPRFATADGIEIDLGGVEIIADGAMTVVMGDGGGGGAVMVATLGSIPAGTMRGFAAPMDLELLAALEEPADHLWAIVQVLHAEYADRYRGAEEQEQTALRELGGGPMGLRPGPGGAPAVPDVGQVDRRHAMTRQAVERLLSIDDLFFNDVAAALADTEAAPALPRLRAMRQREALIAAAGGGGGGPMMMAMLGSREPDVDMVQVLDAADLGPESRRALEPSLLRWEDAATATQRQRYETSAAQQRIIDRHMAEMAKVDDEGRVEISVNSDDEGFMAFQKAQERLAAASSSVVTLHRQARDEMLQQLSPDAARLLRRAYGRAAFPGIYTDPQSVSAKLERVAELDDLTDEQERAVIEVLAAHHDAYDGFCDRMVGTESSDTGFRFGGGSPDPDTIQAMQARQSTMRRLRFERSELGAATLRTLAALLSPEQIERVGGLEPPAPPARGAAIIEIER